MNIGKGSRNVNDAVDPRYAAWLEAGRVFAERMIAERSTYASGRAALQFYFSRKSVELAQGSSVRAAGRIDVRPETLRKFLVTRGGVFGLKPDAQRQAEFWASSLAIHGAQYREALFTWNRCLLLAAIHYCNGNHLAAARLLDVHRNTVWRIPDSPEQTRMMSTRRVYRRTANVAA